MGWTSFLAAGEAGSLSGHWTWIDWAVVIGYLVFTTALGGALAGKQATIRDFFLGGRKLPWYAVAGSIIATEISAVTFIVVPFLVFRPGGDMTYLQLGLIGSLLARLIVAVWLVPAYYKREIYSPYDYMANQLGAGVRGMTTALFTLTGMLAQGARVYLTAVVLQLILKEPLGRLAEATGISGLTWSIWIIGIVAILWTLMGGITTVIWTDVILFLVFLIGAVVALLVIADALPGGIAAGMAEVFRSGREAGKFRFWEWDPHPTVAYTVWTAAIANTWSGVGAYGTDQLLAQRMFCCRTPRDARLAIVASWLGQVVTVTVALVGVGLYTYYTHYPLQGEALAMYQEKGDRIFPIFILSVIPTGLTGLIIAGVFAAAISSLDSILAALSQTSISAFYLPWRKRQLQRRSKLPGFEPVVSGRAAAAEEADATTPPPPPPTGAAAAEEAAEHRRTVIVSRGFVIFWGIILCMTAQISVMAAEFYPSLLDLALAMAGYAGGALLAGFLLGFLPLGINGWGYLWSGPLSVLTVFAAVWHQPWAQVVCWAGGIALLVTWLAAAVARGSHRQSLFVQKTLALSAGVVIMLLASHLFYWEGPIDPKTDMPTMVSIAWPWYAPLGSLVAFIWGYILADRRPS